jgi:hypothetical protein
MRLTILTAIAALALATTDHAAPYCASGLPCGASCIAKGAVCRQPAAAPLPHCSQGKLCGKICIVANKPCHK